MCGIAGILNLTGERAIDPDVLEGMIALLHHRGPDGVGFYRDRRAGLAHARLSIIDLEGGRQPMANEDQTLWIVFNGEIFNYQELRQALMAQGHRFTTQSDTEVIVHLYEELGVDCLKSLNGQFAFALWDSRKGELFIARDRVGIRPLFYTLIGEDLLFASEIKAIFADDRVAREIDPLALDQIFTFWVTLPPRTAFRAIQELPAGHYMTVRNGTLTVKQYWDPDFTPGHAVRREEDYAEELKELLIDATRLQLRADVPVGAYLSGGLDSSVITSLIKNYTDTPLRTFSITFSDAEYDESPYQRQMIDYLHADHSALSCSAADIGKVFSEVLWHTELPIVRTAPAPMYLLAQLVRASGYKVVLTGEGSDEILAGYDLFKEVKVKRFLARCPGSAKRALILKRLYPYLAASPVQSLSYAQAFFNHPSSGYPASCASHAPRWDTTAKIKLFYADGFKSTLAGLDHRRALTDLVPEGNRDELAQAQYLEMKMLLPGYLLSSQGDRVGMAHSIEGRFPFLDHRVVEFCCKLPPSLKMRALAEKYLLKKSMVDIVPAVIRGRSKQPYRAPDAGSLVGEAAPAYAEELLSERRLRDSGYFDPGRVGFLLQKCREHKVLGFKDNMALVGILSTQVLHDHFINNFAMRSRDTKARARGNPYYAGKNGDPKVHH